MDIISINDENIKKRILELIEDKYVEVFPCVTGLGTPVKVLTLTNKGWAVLAVCADRPMPKPPGRPKDQGPGQVDPKPKPPGQPEPGPGPGKDLTVI